MSDPVTFPELIFGTAGPIGIDMDGLAQVITEALQNVGYTTTPIKLTREMRRLKPDIPVELQEHGKAGEYKWKMDYANALRRKYVSSDALARLAVFRIRELRALANASMSKHGLLQGDPQEAPVEKMAYIIRQLKHPAEVNLLRQVYGKQFILISAYASEQKRRKRLLDDIKITESTQEAPSILEYKAIALMERDSSEIGEKLGQQLRDAFHLADVFVDGLSIENMKIEIQRFVNAFFGKTDITPRKDEYGMYAAKSASLRSSDLSRQVGAAIFTKKGELITQGCNEVPKAGGGTYWEGEVPDHRDIRKGYDPNDRQKRELIRDIIERLRVGSFLSQTAIDIGGDEAIVERMTKKGGEGEEDGILNASMAMDLTEFGRIVHAEMCAICDAARNGKSIAESILFCTTFPCHNCTKHIIASGITRVVFMEPYPKSRAKELHEDEIEFETETSDKLVSYVPFLGVSPQRYRDIFQKGRRKTGSGGAAYWIAGRPQPMLDIGFPAYPKTSEPWAIAPLLGDLMPAEN